ncbi:MAG TPA: nucleotide sugar dehydrogenase [Bacillota bacterium]|nr:nucleotide sugar dehydrogenase [Bacillota bacterium]
MQTIIRQLKEKITCRQAKTAVIGLGYVGLPIAVELANLGFPVTGIDVNRERVEMLRAGENFIADVDSELLQELVKSGRLAASDNYSSLAEADIIVICVPTPLTPARDPDMSYIQSAATELAKYIHPGQLISLESTTYPGTTSKVLLPQLRREDLRVGEHFFLAYSPERVDPGNPSFKTKNTTKVVGGITENCVELACLFYRQSISKVVPVSSTEVAELSKVFENTYRAVNIALVNELMMLCDRMNIDVWEVIEAASTKPFGIQTFYPGPGVGGHCIPVDPYYLVWKAREFDFETRMIELSGQINQQASRYVVEKVRMSLNESRKCVNDARILVLGVAYKKDVDDYRESPALKIIPLLIKEGARVRYHDPHIPVIELGDAYVDRMYSCTLTQEELAAADCVLIITDHSSIDYSWVTKWSQLVVDTRNATKHAAEGREKIRRL